MTPSRRWPPLVARAVIAALALPLASCGYALVGRASNVPAEVRAVYLQPLANQTQRAQVDQILTQAIAEELVTRHRFDVVSAADGADATLSGAVLAAGLTPVTFDPGGRATEYEISIVVKVEFRRKPAEPEKPGEVIWASDRYVFRESYPLEVSETGFFDRENIALEEAAERFAETMVSDLLEGF